MKTIRETQKKYGSCAMMVAIFVSLGFILLGQKAIGKGLILGTLFSIINFVLMGETLPARVVQKKSKAFFLSLGSIFFRYGLMAIPLIMAIKSEAFSLFGVIAGLFSVQLLLVCDHGIKILSFRRKEKISKPR